MPTKPSPPSSGIPRRTVTRGAAWAVPVVAVATAAPALAVSGDCTVTGSLDSVSCKDTTSNNFKLAVCFTSTCDSIVDLVLQSVSSSTSYDPVYVSYELGKNGSQCQLVSVPYNPNQTPTTLDLNTVIDYPSGQRQQTFTVTAPTKTC